MIRARPGLARSTWPPLSRSQPLRCFLQEDRGYSALEAAVAVVLLSVVLVPLGAFAVHLALDRQGRQYAEALAAAEAYLETTPAAAPPGTDSLTQGRFLLRREVTAEQALRVVVVSARRRSGPDRRTLVTLRTARYVPDLR